MLRESISVVTIPRGSSAALASAAVSAIGIDVTADSGTLHAVGPAAAFIVGSAILVALLQKAGATTSELFLLLGLGSIAVAVAIGRTMPASALSDALSILYRALFRIEVHGLENLHKAGPNVIIALNHLSQSPTVSLSDILSPSRLLALLQASPSLAESLYTFLPPPSDTVPHNEETLRRVVTSPELRKAARSLDHALQSGALGPLAQSLGLCG